MGRLRRLFGGTDESAKSEEVGENSAFVRGYDVTEVDWTDNWERIYIDRQDKQKLVNYGLVNTPRGQAAGLPASTTCFASTRLE